MRLNPPMPSKMSWQARDFITQLLVKDPLQRLGSGKNGFENIKKHPFFEVQNSAEIDFF